MPSREGGEALEDAPPAPQPLTTHQEGRLKELKEERYHLVGETFRLRAKRRESRQRRDELSRVCDEQDAEYKAVSRRVRELASRINNPHEL